MPPESGWPIHQGKAVDTETTSGMLMAIKPVPILGAVTFEGVSTTKTSHSKVVPIFWTISFALIIRSGTDPVRTPPAWNGSWQDRTGRY